MNLQAVKYNAKMIELVNPHNIYILILDQYCFHRFYETTFHEYNDKQDYEQCFMRLLFIYVRMKTRIQSVIIKSFPFNFKIIFNVPRDSYCKYT